MRTSMTFATTVTALALCVSVPDYAAATQSDLLKFCIDERGRKTPVRYIAGRQTCGSLETIFIDRPDYSPRDFATRASDEVDECTEADFFLDSHENEITLCVGLLEIVPPDSPPFLQCSIWLDGADEYLVMSNGTEPAGFLATPEGNNIFAFTQQATPGAHGGAARDITFFHPDGGYIIEVDLEFLIWPIDGDCVAVDRASNATLEARD
jgi:hypothetical protein